jgi:chromosome segregation ATPase
VVRLLSVAALLLGLGLTFFLIRMNQEYEVREKELGDKLVKLGNVLSAIGEQLDAGRQSITSLTADVELVQKRVGLTQKEIKRARAVAEQLRKEQEKDVELLTDQILRKADSQEVVDLDEKAETKFQEVDQQITKVQERVETGRKEAEKTWKELAALGVALTEQGRLIATTGGALEELKRQGERDYLQFEARKKQKMSVAGITIELRKADRKKHRADLRLFYDDKRVEKKKVYTNTPLIFYVGRDKIQYELVINQVKKDQIAGYISVPKGKLPSSPELKPERSTD